ncbi:hypothetical protein [Bacteroides reticulotermitis]|uniref:hypothetical protein n=1 Tax=Bacteroides reticulotermitis TaxID=1133319 RepID=UPI001FCB3682|nr:hypothetical protein [Bacteroides reticulotermitis]
MKTILSIEKIQSPLQVNNPFIMAVHHNDHYPKGNEKMEPVHYLPTWQVGRDFNRMHLGGCIMAKKFPVFRIILTEDLKQ